MPLDAEKGRAKSLHGVFRFSATDLRNRREECPSSALLGHRSTCDRNTSLLRDWFRRLDHADEFFASLGDMFVRPRLRAHTLMESVVEVREIRSSSRATFDEAELRCPPLSVGTLEIV